MKNKGRRHKAAHNERMTGILDCKGLLTHITRKTNQMGKSPAWVRGKSKKFTKRKWSKRVRGYSKSQTKNIFGDE